MTADTNNAHEAIEHWNAPLGLPDYASFEGKDLEAIFEKALPLHLDEIDKIANNPDAPSFENTIIALELAGKTLDKVSAIFWNLTGSHTNDFLQSLERKMAPEMARHFSKVMLNSKLFERVDTLYQARENLNLDAESTRVLEKARKSFIRFGANISPDDQGKLAKINERLAGLGTSFAQNMLADEQDYALILNEPAELAGLPNFLIAAMASAAEERGHKGKHAVTLSRSIIEPFLTFSDRRDLRETAFKAWGARGAQNGNHDNRPLISEIVKLRAEKARLLGYESFAAYKLDDTMAKTPENVATLLNSVWEKASTRASEEEADLADLIANEGKNHEVAPWDWRYYTEKARTKKFNFDQGEVKPYLQLDNIIKAAFETATRLFGVSFKEQTGITSYHPDVRIFEVLDADNNRIAVFLADYFARSSKRSGAWMSALQSQHKLGGGQMPIIMNNMNFAKPPEGEPCLLSMDDARTLFHEFGHALHGMLSDVTYPSISGTSVSRDFVELPSQLYEHWLTVPETLEKYATHYQTGEPIPARLIEKLLAAQTFNSGFATVEFTSSALVDMAYHNLNSVDAANIDPVKFQKEVLDKINMPKAIVMRHASPHFAHVFSGDGYSAGYYSYMWSEVLDADAFRAFEEKGNPFDAETAAKLKTHIYSSGGSHDPEDAYIAFRGKLPSPEAMLEKKGLAG